MTPERWREVTEIFHAARVKAAGARPAFLDGACSHDPSLRGDVEKLLAADDQAGDLGEVPFGAATHLTPGALVGPYRIEALEGAGGMGEVYRATDTRLNRAVAIKILAHAFSNHSEFRSRFEREARVLASLSHPHIAGIHGAEHTADGLPALVLEFVEGPTLADRLERGRVRWREALTIARQIAGAVGAAHDKGIVHRDLKPANVKLTPASGVKVLDFGIAKLASAPGAPGADLTTFDGTQEGAIIGTAAYMSPEQARGQPVDKRTDVWAFGCVLYEMLAGRRPFDGGTRSDTAARILEREPDWTALPADVPDVIRRLLRRCLKKDPADRMRDIADVEQDIADALEAPETARPAGTSGRPRWLWPAVAAGFVAVVAAIAWSFIRDSGATPSGPAIEIGVRFPDGVIPSGTMEVSPDGRSIAIGMFSNVAQIWLYSLDSPEPRLLAGSDGMFTPFWSPDGSKIGFSGGGKIRAVPVAGGPAVEICSIPPPQAVSGGAAWNTDGIIVFAANRQFYSVPATGGTPVSIAGIGEPAGSDPRFLPDQRHFIHYRSAGGGSAWLRSLGSTGARKIVDSGAPASFAPPHHLLYMRGGSLVAQTLNLDTFALEGEPVVVVPNVSLGILLGDRASFAVSPAGVLAYAKPRGGSFGQLTWFDRQGQAGGSLPSPADTEYLNPSFSPDGTQVAANVMDPRTGNWDIWVVDVARGIPSRVTFGESRDTDPIWSNDGREIIFVSDRGGRLELYRKAVAGSGPETLVTTTEGSATVIPSDWSRDGKYVFWQQLSSGVWSIWTRALTGERQSPARLADLQFSPYAGHLSPDGRWLAYTSFASGPAEIYVQRFMVPGQMRQISTGGGAHPRWTSDGRELVYWGVPGGIYAVDFEPTGETFRVGARRTLVQQPVLGLIDARTPYDITRDGRRLIVRQPAGPQGHGISVVLNWTERLKKAPAR